ncbi:MAG TPA: hypothetical protein VM580_05375 [Labilithrix sp.]|nr:hypothetical protein [Labilithrix sp.]
MKGASRKRRGHVALAGAGLFALRRDRCERLDTNAARRQRDGVAHGSENDDTGPAICFGKFSEIAADQSAKLIVRAPSV